MSLAPGSRIGPYEITAAIGAGGMGEVFRARDTKLNRDVAIKVLPAAFAQDHERVARFKREAQVLASLNHPNIAAIHGLEESTPSAGSGSGSIVALVMELVEGEDLSAHIARGAIPIAEVLPIARQIADGLEEAHERGIVHRDLKPANIKITPDGKVKILDFGLAKALDTSQGASGAGSVAELVEASHSPTMSRHMTDAGMIMGTAAYMSPEQARGKAVDRRADIWSFGVVLFEMLSGARLFAGETVSDTLAAVLKTDPDWGVLPADTPVAIRRLLRRCLEKDPKRRLGWIGVVRHDLEEAESADGAAASTKADIPASRRAPLFIGSALVGALIMGLFANASGWGRTPPDPAGVTRLSMEMPRTPGDVIISPDGSRVLLSVNGLLETRLLSDFQSVPVKTPGLSGMSDMAFSPDGQSITFVAGTVLRRLPISGGAAIDLADLKADVLGCSWSDGHVYCGLGEKGVIRVPENGGTVEQIVSLKPGEYAATPRLLPGGGGDLVLFTLATGTQRADWQHAGVALQSLSSGRRETIVAAGSDPRYLPTGHIAYVVDGVWVAAAFDTKSGRILGSPAPMIEGVARRNQGGLLMPRALIDVSATGTLVYLDGPVAPSNRREIVVADRSGKERVLTLAPKAYEAPRISPDGRQMAVSIAEVDEAAIWVYDLSEAFAIRRLTFSGRNRLPLWSPDGKSVAFQSDRGGDVALYLQRVDGSGEAQRLTTAEPGTTHVPESWSRDGRYLSYSVNGQGGSDLWLRSMADGQEARFGDVHSNAPLNSALSPDGKWIAYGLRGDRGRVFVQPIPATGARYQVSPEEDIGHHPFWSPDMKELFYFASGGGALSSVSIAFNGGVILGRPAPVRGTHPSNTTALGPLNYDISPDGRAFVFTRGHSAESGTGGQDERGSIKVVLNWFSELKSRVPVK